MVVVVSCVWDMLGGELLVVMLDSSSGERWMLSKSSLRVVRLGRLFGGIGNARSILHFSHVSKLGEEI